MASPSLGLPSHHFELPSFVQLVSSDLSHFSQSSSLSLLSCYSRMPNTFLLRGVRHAIARHTSTAHLCKSTLRFGRRKTIVHRTMCALPEAISAGGLTPTTDTSLFLTTYRTPLKKSLFCAK